ncbi:MAG: sensor histidine kinase [Acidobacteriota bacterium]|nr:sensor histidine kinase [Acidobacteriota bacterium]MDQ3417978.1 sensor histidine kinase [Acidobacteriota bacterium]
MMTGIRARFALFVAVAAVAPLLIYGGMSVRSLRSATEQSVSAGNLAVAREVAARFRDYFENNRRILEAIGSQMQDLQLADWQQQRLLKNHVMDFDELRQISLIDAQGRPRFSSRESPGKFTWPINQPRRFAVARLDVDADQLPTALVAIPFDDEPAPGGWIVAEISLEQLWREVDQIRIGSRGYAMLIDGEGRIIAHGDPDKRALAVNRTLATEDERRLATLSEAAIGEELPRVRTDTGTMVAAPAKIGTPDWTVIIEQPEDEALAVAQRLERQLYLAICVALLATVAAGSWWGRSFIQRIFALTRVTDALAAGKMDARVAPTGRDEIAQLGTQFNAMADRLVELQGEIRTQERQVMFGRIAAGLVHDLSHPIQNIGNSCKLIQRVYDDPEYRTTFRTTVERELATVKRVLEDLRNIARPMPLERFAVDLNASLREAVETMAPLAETAGVTLRAELAHEPAYVEGDLFAIGRVHRNLMLNAIQATAPGGLVVAATEVERDRVVMKVYDTGCGIPSDRLPHIFEDFVTTKRRGLGLGLAISKKITQQLGGEIRVVSEVGRGTTFELEFPRAAEPPIAG